MMRIVTNITDGKVSTVDLGVYFETMTFAGGDEVASERTKTRAAAREAHRLAVSNATIGGSGCASYWDQSISASVMRSARAVSK